jgi:hypothetical protein
MSAMAVVQMFKMPFATAHFNANQRVWIVQITGALAALCVGRFRGKGRYVEAWVRWDSKAKQAPEFQTFEVSDTFADRHGLRRERQLAMIVLLGLTLLTGCAADLPTAPSRSTAVGTVTVTATPAAVLLSGSTVQLQVRVLTTDGVRRPGVPVRFATSAGTLEASDVTTDANGEASTTLTASSSATVSVSAEDKTERVSLAGVAPFSVEIQQSFEAIIYSDQWMAPVAVVVNRDAISPPRPVRVTLDCGVGAPRTVDGFIGMQMMPCNFGRLGTFTVRATATAENGWSTSGQRQVVVVERPAIPIAPVLSSIRRERTSSSETWEFSAFVENYSSPPVRWEWSFGDGQAQTTTSSRVSHRYTSEGVKTVEVRVFTADGKSGNAMGQIIVDF